MNKLGNKSYKDEIIKHLHSLLTVQTISLFQGSRQCQKGLLLFSYPHNLRVASGTGWCKELFIAALTVHTVLLLHKAHISQGCLAVSTIEFFWVPRATHGYQERTSGNNHNLFVILFNLICIVKKRLNDPDCKPTFSDTMYTCKKLLEP